MKKIIGLSCFATLMLAGCTVKESEIPQNKEWNFPTFYASFDDNEDETTKTYVDEKMKLRWTEDDRLSIFAGNTFNHEYKYDGETGANNGSFSAISNPEFFAAEPLETNYAVYPYAASHEMDPEYGLSVVLPSVQKYAENSFGLGANTMVAATENKQDNFLQFKNLCGYVVVKLYGTGTVKSIKLEGKDGEKISGKANVQAVYGEFPSVSMSEDATSSITLDCGEGVTLGTTAETATEFWFCVPPITFSRGFIVTVVDTEGMGMIKSVSSSCDIIRNTVHSMPLLQATFERFIGLGVPFEDPAFKAYCVENFDTDGDGEVSPEEAAVVTEINCRYLGIKSLAGIELFTALTSLYCDGNQLPSLDVSRNTALIRLECGNNPLASLDVSKNTALEILYCMDNQLTSLDVSKNTALTYLSCGSNQLPSLDVSNNTALTSLFCYFNQLTDLDVSNNTALTVLHCDYNQLTSLGVSRNTALKFLSCYTNQLPSLDVSNNTALTSLGCGNNKLTSLDVSNNTALTSLDCDGNYLTSLDVSKNTALTSLGCSRNQLLSLDVSKNILLDYLNCALMNTLEELYIFQGQEIPYVTDNRSVDYIPSQTQIIEVTVPFEDPAFKAYCVENFDTNGDGEISPEEAAVVTEINCRYLGIKSLAGIELFTALTYLYCDNNQLTSLDVSNNTALTWLECFDNQLACLDVSNNTALTYLSCRGNQLTSLNVSKNTALTSLSCDKNQLTSIDVSNNTALTYLTCYSNQLTGLDVSNNTALTSLLCSGNPLASLDVSNNTALTHLSCRGNQLTSLDVSRNTDLTYLSCRGNQLTSLDVSKNILLEYLDCALMNTLEELYIFQGQEIPYVTDNRSVDYIPSQTQIIEVTDTP